MLFGLGILLFFKMMPVDFRKLMENCVGLKTLKFKVSLNLQVVCLFVCYGVKQVNQILGEAESDLHQSL